MLRVTFNSSILGSWRRIFDWNKYMKTNPPPQTTVKGEVDFNKEFDYIWNTGKSWGLIASELKRLHTKHLEQAIKQERSRVVDFILDEVDVYIEAKDNDGHRYQIPDSKQQEWDEFLEIPEDDERSWDVPKWAERIDGMPIKQHGLNKLLEALKEL